MAIRGNEPRQERSRHTLYRLLSATEALLEHGGLEAATVPAIAKAAGVSVGVVYRRFPDKDMLLRAIYTRFYETAMQPAAIAGSASLRDVARTTINRTIESYRRKRGLLRALTHYARTHRDSEFRDAARKMSRAPLLAIQTLLLAHREEIDHPDPDAAISFAVVAVNSILQHAVLEDRMPHRFDDELVRLLFRYLGIGS
ncbi:MAG TPA: TetR/AcrR family transcriptional regulator [Thermoanaerobaculia bacterium]|nr:TetR/AcrR family transcriptional regulator [Thermoanaerobaculia bacterium]